MVTNHVQEGDVLTVTAPAGLSSGDEVLIGTNLFGVAVADALITADVEIMVTGVFDLTKEAPLVISAGDLIYWDVTNSQCTTTSLNNLLIGICTLAAASADTEVRVKLQGAGMSTPAILDDGDTLPVMLSPAATVRETWVAPVRGTMTGLGWTAETQPASAAGTYTCAIANETDSTNQLSTATQDLDATITADTYLAGTLTATVANRNFDQGDVFSFTFTSSNVDLVGAGLVQVIRYRHR
jgi:predicted RecA/RadA family phage recombinase